MNNFSVKLTLFYLMKLVGFFFKGFDCCPKLFTQDNGGNLTFITDLDIPQEKETGKIRYVVTLHKTTASVANG